jgi:hypothetical protein
MVPVTADVQRQNEITEKDLHHWQVLRVVDAAIQRVFARAELTASLTDPARKLRGEDYLSLFFLGLFNPVVESMRGLCGVSRLARVQQAVGCGPVSLGSFSEIQHVIEPELMRQVFREVLAGVPVSARAEPSLQHLNIILQDGSLWSALPRMAWAKYGVGPDGQAKGVRLHLRFHLADDRPDDARIKRGASCERDALREMCVAGQTNVGDRYYGEDYKLFGEIDRAQGFFVFRIKAGAVVNLEEDLPISAADRAVGVVRHAWVRLGATPALLSLRLRLVEIKTADQHLFLVTNLPMSEAAAELIGLIYRRRWTIELFFRWVKCILGCRHFFAESPKGVAIQLYLALIAAVMFQFYSGRRPSKRIWELIQMYLLGWASAVEFEALLAEEAQRQAARKKH